MIKELIKESFKTESTNYHTNIPSCVSVQNFFLQLVRESTSVDGQSCVTKRRILFQPHEVAQFHQ